MNEQKKKDIPRVQYALFCKEVIESGATVTFSEVMHEIFVGRPKFIDFTLVMRLLNVPKGTHEILVNFLIPPSDLRPYKKPLEVEKRENCFLTIDFKQVPIESSNIYAFTILFNKTSLIQLLLPVKVLPKL